MSEWLLECWGAEYTLQDMQDYSLLSRISDTLGEFHSYCYRGHIKKEIKYHLLTNWMKYFFHFQTLFVHVSVFNGSKFSVTEDCIPRRYNEINKTIWNFTTQKIFLKSGSMLILQTGHCALTTLFPSSKIAKHMLKFRYGIWINKPDCCQFCS